MEKWILTGCEAVLGSMRGWTYTFKLMELHTRLMVLAVMAMVASSPAQASYAQMKLDGLIAILLLALTSGYALLIGVLLLFKAFRSRVMVILNTGLSVALTGLWIMNWSDLRSLINDASRPSGGGMALLILLAIALAILLVFGAPLAQYRAMRPRLRA